MRELGLIGLGKMGGNLAYNLNQNGVRVSAYDAGKVDEKVIDDANINLYPSIEALVLALPTPRLVWLMVPSGDITNSVVESLAGLLTEGDTIIDGGNSFYKDSKKLYLKLKEKNINFIDIGTSGGTSGARNGVCIMVGGDREVVARYEDIFKEISVPNGYLYSGTSGSGHYLKMVHNAIEYGMMQSIAEGYEILDAGPYDYDFSEVSLVWNSGSVIRSWLIELLAEAFDRSVDLDAIGSVIDSSGEGKWAVQEAIDYEISIPVITQSLFTRYSSKNSNPVTNRVISVLRNEFGGHSIDIKE